MAKKQIFYSFHYDNDVFRVQQIRNIGALEDNVPVSANEWEQIKKNGDAAIQKWIDDNMKYRSCVIVLIGTETANRKWVQYEIKKAWSEGKKLIGIYIHNIKDPRTSNSHPYFGKCAQGPNPFAAIKLQNGVALSSYIPCYNPKADDAYNDIAANLEKWIA